MINLNLLWFSLLVCLFTPLLSGLCLSILNLNKITIIKKEYLTVIIIKSIFLINLFFTLMAFIAWIRAFMPTESYELFKLYILPDYHLHFSLFVDLISIIYLLCSTLIVNIICFFSTKYMHRDPGFTRFFTVVSFFTFGINLVSLSGTLDITFAAWEIMGISSFLLIGYFWHRPKAIVAANRAYYIFRVCDLGFLAGVLITHFYWHDATTFEELNKWSNLQSEMPISLFWHWILSICLLLPVLGKSAQFPFSFWLPKAMEGPTSSSALFYGSLSIHAGVFLLIRTMPIWQSTPGFSYLLGSIGLITALSCSLFAHVQSNIKGQIGYTSIAQVGIILIELALGLKYLALFHMVGNTFLRCFQLLVSPSIIATHLQLQSLEKPTYFLQRYSVLNLVPKKFHQGLFIFALNEGYFEAILIKIFVTPIKIVSEACYNNLFIFNKISSRSKLNAISETIFFSFIPPLLLMFSVISSLLLWPELYFFQALALTLSLFLSLCALAEKKDPVLLLSLVILSYALCYLCIIFVNDVSLRAIIFFFLGLVISFFVCLYCMHHIKKHKKIISFEKFLGLYYFFPRAGTLFLISILGIIAFPLSTSFFAEDLLLHLSIHKGLLFVICFHLIFVINGINLIQMTSSVLYGKRQTTTQESLPDFCHLKALMCLTIFIIGNFAAYFIFVN